MAKIAIMGFGTVGSGVLEVCRRNAASIARRAGEPVEVKYILDVRDFSDSPDAALFTSYDWPEIRIIQIPSFNFFQFHATSKHFQRPISKAACCSSLASASTSARATISSSISI